MLTSVEGTFRNGHVELQETTNALEGARVIVTFLPQEPAATAQGPSSDPLTALQRLTEFRRELPPVDAVELIREGREDLAARNPV